MSDRLVTTTDLDALSREIECLVCLSPAYDCRMCVHCSAILCIKCIEEWIDRRHNCPKCSRHVDEKDFVPCRLVNKLIDFTEVSRSNNCEKHAKEIPRLYCSTCEKYVCLACLQVDGQHLDHDFQYIDENTKKMLTLIHQLIDFIRQRIQRSRDEINALEIAIEMLLNDHNENLHEVNPESSRLNSLIEETQVSLDDYQQKKLQQTRLISADEMVLNEIQRLLERSRTLNDQERILQLLQKHILM